MDEVQRLLVWLTYLSYQGKNEVTICKSAELTNGKLVK
jgi:hypothetical protein